MFDTFVDAYDLIPSSELPYYPPNFEDPLAMVQQAMPPGPVVVGPVPLPGGKVVEFAVDPRAAIEGLREGLFGTVTFFRHGGVREWLGVLRYLPYEPVYPSLELGPVPTPGP
jgi:hypothetical protein